MNDQANDNVAPDAEHDAVKSFDVSDQTPVEIHRKLRFDRAEVDLIRAELKRVRDRVHGLETRTDEAEKKAEVHEQIVDVMRARLDTTEHRGIVTAQRVDNIEYSLGMFTIRLDALIDDLHKIGADADIEGGETK